MPVLTNLIIELEHIVRQAQTAPNGPDGPLAGEIRSHSEGVRSAIRTGHVIHIWIMSCRRDIGCVNTGVGQAINTRRASSRWRCPDTRYGLITRRFQPDSGGPTGRWDDARKRSTLRPSGQLLIPDARTLVHPPCRSS